MGEGFSAFRDPETNRKTFDIVLSVEKEQNAYQTLMLRSFYRHLKSDSIPEDYYRFLRGEITLETLYEKWPEEAGKARKETWKAELGDGERAVSWELVDKRIQEALKGSTDWILIGGPPCQAYSVVGRSRRRERMLDEKKDERVGLYKQYLRILAVHNPPVFVMENVRGLLSAQTKESPLFRCILRDIADPVRAYLSENGDDGPEMDCPGYHIYSLAVEPEEYDDLKDPVFNQNDFIIYAEKHGIPQSRHRVILLGIRRDIDLQPEILPLEKEIKLYQILSDLPKLRSSISKKKDNEDQWKKVLLQMLKGNILNEIEKDVREEIKRQLEKIQFPSAGTGNEFLPVDHISVGYRPDWYLDERLKGVCNHTARAHMESDLLRYLFVACFGKVKKRSPKLVDFPPGLLPLHKNVQDGISENKFDDRFRVQLSSEPCKTITSHISKDGHYYIHHDPSQCRSFTVREAARVQTFPDNYYFCGSRTAQFVQVGNAVPPLLANKIASIVNELFAGIRFMNSSVIKSNHSQNNIRFQFRFNFKKNTSFTNLLFFVSKSNLYLETADKRQCLIMEK